jgi:hypothetical protein
VCVCVCGVCVCVCVSVAAWLKVITPASGQGYSLRVPGGLEATRPQVARLQGPRALPLQETCSLAAGERRADQPPCLRPSDPGLSLSPRPRTRGSLFAASLLWADAAQLTVPARGPLRQPGDSAAARAAPHHASGRVRRPPPSLRPGRHSSMDDIFGDDANISVSALTTAGAAIGRLPRVEEPYPAAAQPAETGTAGAKSGGGTFTDGSARGCGPQSVPSPPTTPAAAGPQLATHNTSSNSHIMWALLREDPAPARLRVPTAPRAEQAVRGPALPLHRPLLIRPGLQALTRADSAASPPEPAAPPSCLRGARLVAWQTVQIPVSPAAVADETAPAPLPIGRGCLPALVPPALALRHGVQGA